MKQLKPLVILSLISGFNLSITHSAEPPVSAQPPTHRELLELLSGNSTKGIWDKKHYLQYFDRNRSTRYQEEGRRPSNGIWRVNQQGQYCSIWPPSSFEVCYDLLVDGTQIYWKSGDHYQPASLIQGNIFNQ